MKRTRVELIRDILEAVQRKGGEIKPTHLLYKANLSHAALQRYVAELIGTGFLEELDTENGKRYRITERGHLFLQEYRKFSTFTERFGI